MLLEKSVNAILTEIYDASSQLPLCRAYTKLGDEEIFCKMPLNTALGLGASLDIDSLDFAENVRASDKNMIMFSSFVQKGETCVYRTKQEVIFDTHCSTVLMAKTLKSSLEYFKLTSQLDKNGCPKMLGISKFSLRT